LPCWTVRETSVELDAADPEILRRGLEAAGFELSMYGTALLVMRGGQIVAEIENGRVTVNRGDTGVVNDIKRAYSTEVVKTAAKRFGYTLTTNKQTGKITAGRRF
jgi:hypothetical protein